MALKDLINKGTEMAKGSVGQGILGNYSEFTTEEATEQFGMYLMNNEEIEIAFKLVRDVLLFTSNRIILIDKQGMTGTKARIVSINLHSLVDVTMETAGFGFDDSELTFTYIKTPNLKAHSIEYASHKLEFPKKFDVQSLYRILQEMAFNNCLDLNGLNK